MFRKILLFMILLAAASGCEKAPEENKIELGTFTDSRDRQVYKTVKIGDTWWMAENLNYHTETGSFFYDENIEKGKSFGRLYDWETAQQLAIEGWILPSKDDFEQLIEFAGGKEDSYTQLIHGGKSKFDAVYAGGKFGERVYRYQGESAFFWSSTPDMEEQVAWCLGLEKDLSVPVINNYNKTCGFSVRLIKKEK